MTPIFENSVLEYRAFRSTGGSILVKADIELYIPAPGVVVSFWQGDTLHYRKVVKVTYNTKRKLYNVFVDYTIHKPKPQPHRKLISNKEKRIFEIKSSLFTKSKQLTDRYIADTRRGIVEGLDKIFSTTERDPWPISPKK